MHPELFTLPVLGISIKTYGFLLMVGFLSAVWLAMRRAERVKANADTILDMSLLSLLFGVLGARLFFVAHYWQPQFANRTNKLAAILDIRQGGLEFLGGFLGALIAVLIYSWWKKVSLRLYLDILAPSTMWGLAFGRLGCFFNGCCFGAVCVVPQTEQPARPWAVQFPFASGAHWQQWEDREVTVPAELITTTGASLQPTLVPAALLTMSVDKRERPTRQYEVARATYERAKAAAPDAEATAALKSNLAALKKAKIESDNGLSVLTLAQRWRSRVVPTRTTSVSELEQLAAGHRSRSVHPTQLYSSIHAMLLCGVLTLLFYQRKRHGVVIAAMVILYAVPRSLLEMIRTDNPHDVSGLTISQFVSMSLLVGGVICLVALYKWFPERSPVLDLETAKPSGG